MANQLVETTWRKQSRADAITYDLNYVKERDHQIRSEMIKKDKTTEGFYRVNKQFSELDLKKLYSLEEGEYDYVRHGLYGFRCGGELYLLEEDDLKRIDPSFSK